MFKLIQMGIAADCRRRRLCFASLMAREDALRLDAFVLEPPDGTELRALLDMLAHEDSGGTSALVDSVDGYGSFKALEEGIVDAWRRGECLVLRESPSDDESAATSPSLGGLYIRPAGRRMLPAFAQVCVKLAGRFRPPRDPYLELIWVSPAARRLGIGRSMVRRVCEQYPTIKGVRSCLPEALPFWDAVSAHISRSAASSRPRPPARPISMDDRVLRELARLRQKDDGEARDEDGQHPVRRNHHAADNG
jgi:GNAT superfamily N-acetyltransferase